MIFYFVVLIICLLIEVIYIYIAEKYNIIDKPNERSLHTNVTIRGGGMIFPLSVLLYTAYDTLIWPHFFMGLILISIISFLDDIFTLSNLFRIIIHFIAVLLSIYELGFFQENTLWIIPLSILMVGIINGYNFMDGINGITAAYSIVIILSLWYVNSNIVYIVDNELLLFVLMGLFSFSLFNFRIKARCFAGDIGSISIAFIILFLIFKFILFTSNFKYLLFLTVYGIDIIFTIIHRLRIGENIFKAHKLHLFQILVYKKKMGHLYVSLYYAILQLIVNILIITIESPFLYLLLIFILSGLYIFLKRKLLRNS